MLEYKSIMNLTKEETKKLGIDLFNKTWEYIEMDNRSPDEDDRMINCVHASKYFWSLVGDSINFQRGDWIISRVYSILGKGDQALIYAKSCLKLTGTHDFKEFDLAFAYEAMARAYAISGNKSEFKIYNKLAQEAGELITKQGDKDYFLKDFSDGDWAEMK